MSDARRLLRHAVATLAYRGGNALRDTPESFGAFEAGSGTRTPEQILAHMGDVLSWALTRARGSEAPPAHEPAGWAGERDRFFGILRELDAHLDSDAPLRAPPEKLLQGPIADAITHVGQLALLRRLAGVKTVPYESYYAADIAPGHGEPNASQTGGDSAPDRARDDASGTGGS